MPNNLKIKKRRGIRNKLKLNGSKVNWRRFDFDLRRAWNLNNNTSS